MVYMSKFPTKFALIIVSFIGIALFFSGGKVHADNLNWRCPTAPNDVPSNWGMQNGGLEHTFASLVVYARVDGKPYNEGKLNVNYHLKSSVDKSYNYGPRPTGVPASLYPDARIFKYAGGVDDISVNGRTDQRWFKTGETMTSPSDHCDGWSELGPGTGSNIGNGFILDCQEKDTGGTLRSNHFWIDSISTPTEPAAGQDGGHWTVEISSGGRPQHAVPYPMAYDSNPNPATSNNLLVVNGENARVDLIWHPNPPKPTCATNPNMPQCRRQVEADCTNAFIENTSTAGGNRKRTHVVVTGVTVNKNGNNGPNYDVHNNIENPDPPGVPYGNRTGTYDNIDQFVPSSGGEQDTDVKTGKKWWYQPNTNKIHIKITVEGLWDNDGNGSETWNYINTVKDTDVQCFAAHCDIQAYGDGPGGLILAGGTIHFRGTYYNDSPPPDYLTLWWPGVKDQNGGVYGVNVEQVLGGGDYPLAFDVGNAGGGNIVNQNWSFTPVYFAGEAIGPACTANVKTFKYFSLQPSVEVQMGPTVEDPTSVRYIGRANITNGFSDPSYPGGFAVHYDADSVQTRYGGGANHLNTVNYGAGNVQTPYNFGPIDPRPNEAGDEYCLNDFYVYETSGYIGPSNEFAYTNADYPPQSACQQVYDRPYLHTYGADVVSGSNFKAGDTCDTTGSSQNIRAFRSTEASKGGSGTQFAALALSQISGFGSASTTSAGPVGLSFANDGNPQGSIGGGGSDQPNDGGGYAGQPMCTRDFYSTQQNPNTYTSTNVNISTSGQIQNGEQTFYNISGNNLTVRANASNFNKQAFIYVDGNVIIKNNIRFQPGKYLAIIAKGDIYIDKSVTRLDGLYVAQPRNSSSGGKIYTCADTSSATPQDIALDARYTQCQAQLVINGAFAAKDVKFHRVANSLRDSVSKETPSNFSDGTGTKAAEIFNFSPEIYLYTPIFEDVTTGGPAQYYTTLPPVL